MGRVDREHAVAAGHARGARRVLPRCALILASLVLALPGQAAANPVRANVPSDLDGSLTTANVVVHFRTTGADAVTSDAAGQVAAATEAALQRFAEVGFPRVKDDGDGHTDVYYFNYAAAEKHGDANRDGTTTTTPGYIRLNTAYDRPLQTVKHEVFHLVQFAIGRGLEGWVAEATASWARWLVDEPPADDFKYIKNFHRLPLNCVKDAGGVCEGFGGGYSTWLFFSSFDATFVKGLLERIAALTVADRQYHGMDALLTELSERGLTLQGVLLELATKFVQGTLPYEVSRSQLPSPSSVIDPPRSGGPATATEIVHHASLGFMGIAATGNPCTTVPLELTLQGPEGVAAVSFVQRGGMAVPLANGQTTVPWIACAQQPAMIAIANGTTTADEQAFAVTGRVITPALSGLAVAARTVRRAGRGFKVPITVESSAAGRLHASLSRAAFKSVPLKQGTNALTLKVPRSFSGDRAVLRLTPFAGPYRGAAVLKRLRFRTRG